MWGWGPSDNLFLWMESKRATCPVEFHIVTGHASERFQSSDDITYLGWRLSAVLLQIPLSQGKGTLLVSDDRGLVPFTGIHVICPPEDLQSLFSWLLVRKEGVITWHGSGELWTYYSSLCSSWRLLRQMSKNLFAALAINPEALIASLG